MSFILELLHSANGFTLNIPPFGWSASLHLKGVDGLVGRFANTQGCQMYTVCCQGVSLHCVRGVPQHPIFNSVTTITLHWQLKEFLLHFGLELKKLHNEFYKPTERFVEKLLL